MSVNIIGSVMVDLTIIYATNLNTMCYIQVMVGIGYLTGSFGKKAFSYFGVLIHYPFTSRLPLPIHQSTDMPRIFRHSAGRHARIFACLLKVVDNVCPYGGQQYRRRCLGLLDLHLAVRHVARDQCRLAADESDDVRPGLDGGTAVGCALCLRQRHRGQPDADH